MDSTSNDFKKYVTIRVKNLTKGKIRAALTAAAHLADAYDLRHKETDSEITIWVPVTDKQPYDMKPAYAMSSKAKIKKNGGWYLVVPIERQVSSMGNALQERVEKAFQEASNFSTTYIDDLYSGRDSGSLFISSLSGNLTKMKDNRGVTNYMAFRTVSDKSPISSWVINKNAINDERYNKLATNIEDVIRGVLAR